jgi:hypothetical protein
MLFPEKVVLSNGLQVVLPPAVTGRAPGGDPRTLELHKQLIEVNRKLLNGTVEIPPEGERSPSPPPIYDVMGMRCAAAAAAWRRLLLHRWPPPLPPPCRAPNCDYARAQLDATP